MKNNKMHHLTKLDFGKFKGVQLIDVPAPYLLHLKRKKIAFGQLLIYIDDNIQYLIEEENKIKQTTK